MKEFQILGHTLSFTQEEEIFFNTINTEPFYKLEEMAHIYTPQLNTDIKTYLTENNIASAEDKIKQIIKYGHNYIDNGINHILSVLLNHGIYDISIEELINNHNAYDTWDHDFILILQQFTEIDHTVSEEKDYRQLRKDSRNRWEGGGFGLEGAINGAITAGTLNAASGLAHSIFNLIGNLGSEWSASSKKDKAIQKMKEISFDLSPSFKALADILEEIYQEHGLFIIPDYRSDLASQRINKQNNIINNLSKISNPEQRKEALVECLALKPDNETIYLTITKYFPHEFPSLTKLLEFVNIHASDIAFDISAEWLPPYTKDIPLLEYAETCLHILKDKEKEYGWSSQELIDQIQTTIKDEQLKQQRILEEESRTRRTIHQIEVVRSFVSSEIQFQESDNTIILKNEEQIQDAEEAKEIIKQIYRELYSKQVPRATNKTSEKLLKHYNVDILVITDDEKKIQTARDEIASINEVYNVAPTILQELNTLLEKYDLEARTVGSTVYETRQAADIERTKYVNGIKYENIRERLTAQEEVYFINSISEEPLYQSDDIVLHNLYVIQEIKKAQLTTQASKKLLQKYEKEIIEKYDDVNADIESAKSHYMIKKKELRKDFTWWWPLSYFILGIITITRQNEILQFIGLCSFLTMIYTIYKLIKAEIILFLNDEKNIMNKKISEARKSYPSIDKCIIEDHKILSINPSVNIRSVDDLLDESIQMLKNSLSDSEKETAGKLILRAAFRGSTNAQQMLSELYKNGDIGNFNDDANDYLSKKWYNISLNVNENVWTDILKG